MRRPLLATLAGALLAAPLAAQTVRGTVASSDGAPVAGALVVLLNEAGGTVATALGDAKGAWRVAAPAGGRYRLRVDRVSFASVTTEPFDLAAGAVVERRLVLTDASKRIAEVATTGKARCVLAADSAGALLDVWEEARKALTAISITEAERRFPMTLAMSERLYKPDGRTLLEQTTNERSGVGNRPFVAPPAAQLERTGYVVQDGDWYTYHAPDARVVLSDEFLGSHCLRLRAPDEAGMQDGRIGLAFAPVGKAPKDRVDVEGTLWLDRRSGELAALEYRYTRLPGGVDHKTTGGRLDFRRLPNGAWIVQRWAIRMPVIGTENRNASNLTDGSTDRSQAVRTRQVPVLQGVKEDAGEVRRIELAPGVVWSADAATLRGRVLDATTGRGLADAAVYLAGTAYLALSDADGRFTLTDLPTGPAQLAVRHPRLDSLALTVAPVPVTLTANAAVEAALRVPSGAEQIAAACPAAPVATLVRGRLRAADGRAIAEATVRVLAADASHAVLGEGRTEPDGTFVLCGLAPDAPVTIRLESGGRGIERTVQTEIGRVVAVPVVLP